MSEILKTENGKHGISLSLIRSTKDRKPINSMQINVDGLTMSQSFVWRFFFVCGDCCWCCCNINFFQTIILACVQCFRIVFVMEYSWSGASTFNHIAQGVFSTIFAENSIDQSVFLLTHNEPLRTKVGYQLLLFMASHFFHSFYRIDASRAFPSSTRLFATKNIYITIVWVLIEALTIIQAPNPIDEIMSFHRVKYIFLQQMVILTHYYDTK